MIPLIIVLLLSVPVTEGFSSITRQQQAVSQQQPLMLYREDGTSNSEQIAFAKDNDPTPFWRNVVIPESPTEEKANTVEDTTKDKREWLQRSLLAARLEMMATAVTSGRALDKVVEQPVVVATDTEILPSSFTRRMSPFAFQRALLKARLELEGGRVTQTATGEDTKIIPQRESEIIPPQLLVDEGQTIIPAPAAAADEDLMFQSSDVVEDEKKETQKKISRFEFQRSLLDSRIKTEAEAIAPAVVEDEKKDTQKKVSKFEFQRSLLESRINTEATAIAPAKTTTFADDEASTLAIEDNIDTVVMQEFAPPPLALNMPITVEPSSATTEEKTGEEKTKMSQFEFQRSLLESRLIIEASEAETEALATTEEKTGEEKAKMSQFEFQRSLLESRLIIEASEAETEAPATTEEKTGEGKTKMSQFEFQRSLLESRLIIEASEAETEAPATDGKFDELVMEESVPPPLKLNMPLAVELSSQTTKEETEVGSSPIVTEENEVFEDSPVVQPVMGSPTAAGSAPLITTKDKPAPSKPRNDISITDLASGVIKALTKPEAGPLELKEQNDEAEILGYVASHVTTSVVEGTKAAWLLATGGDNASFKDDVTSLAEESAKQLGSAFSGFAALGLCLADRTQEYLEKARVERLEAEKLAQEARIVAEKLAEEARKEEEERQRMEEARMAVEMQMEEKRKLLEEKAIKEIQQHAQALIDRIDKMAAVAQKKAVDEIKMHTLKEKRKLLDDLFHQQGEQLPVLEEPTPFFANEL